MDPIELPVADLDYAMLVIGLAWLAILAMLLGGIALEAVRFARRREKALFFQRLDHGGITLTQAEQVADIRTLGAMARRCSSCAERAACRRALRWGWLGYAPPPCPNRDFFARFAGART